MFVFAVHVPSHHLLRVIVYRYGNQLVQVWHVVMSGHPNITLFIPISKKRICLDSFAAASLSTCNGKSKMIECLFWGKRILIIFKGKINDATNKWAIDGTALEHSSGQLYLTWSDWKGDTPSLQLLYIVRMSNWWKISSECVVISNPTFDWEKSGGADISEGSEVRTLRSTYTLFLSARIAPVFVYSIQEWLKMCTYTSTNREEKKKERKRGRKRREHIPAMYGSDC